MIEWLADAWSQTQVVRVVEGGENGGPIAERITLAELKEASSLATLQTLTTGGRFTGDICRCPGNLTIAIHGPGGMLIASASVHGYGSVSWDRARFRNDLIVADPTGFHLFLAEHGIPGQLTTFLTPLADLLSLHEGRPQFRPARQRALPYLANRGVTEAVHKILAAAIPASVDRAAILLSWLGRLSIPAEALWGEGVLVRQLLADFELPDIATAASVDPTGHLAMGIVNLSMHTRENRALATAISPVMRRLFPPPLTWR